MSVQWIGLVLMAATINAAAIQENESSEPNKCTVYMSESKIVELRDVIGVPRYPSHTELSQKFRIAIIGETLEKIHDHRKSYLKLGTLTYTKFTQMYTGPGYFANFFKSDDSYMNSFSEKTTIAQPISIVWDDVERGIPIKFNGVTQGLGLSELFYFNGNLMATSRNSNKLYYVNSKSGELEDWITIDESSKTNYLFEWATSKTGAKSKELYVGSTGLSNSENVFIVQKNGNHAKWVLTKTYKDLKQAGDIKSSGHMMHTSCTWSLKHKRFFMMPSRAANDGVEHKMTQEHNTNLLLSMDEYFNYSELKSRIGTIDNKKTYASIKFLPSNGEEIIVALQKFDDFKDVSAYKTYIQIFTINGDILLDSQAIQTQDKNIQYSGFEFLTSDPILKI